MKRWVVATGFALLLALPACNRDKLLAGRKYLATDPVQAVTFLKQAVAEKPSDFDSQMYLGLALEKTGDLAGAAAAYEAALATPEAGTRSDPVPFRLLDAYEKLHQAATAKDAQLAIAKKAAAIEAAQKVPRAWANQFLATALTADLQAAAQAGRTKDVRAAATALQALYLQVDKKRDAAFAATDALKAIFVKSATQAFKDKVAGELAEAGHYDATGDGIALVNRFTVPSADEDAAFDPDADAFKVNLRKAACLPLRKQLGEVLGKVVPVIGIKAPGEPDVDALFARLFNDSKAGYVAPGGEKKPPAGQAYLCQIRTPLASFLGELYRFSE